LSRIRIAVVDDSPFIRKALSWMLAEEPDLQLVGTASRGEDLLSNLQHWRADLIILDLAMPGIGGLATLEEIRIRRPTPVIILSDNLSEGVPLAVEALHSGALDFIDKRDLSLVDFDALRKLLVGRVRQLTRESRKLLEVTAAAQKPAGRPAERRAPRGLHRLPALLLVGASTGGPPAIERVLRDLGPGLRCPVLIAQHMPPRFTRAFAARLSAHLPMEVREATDGEPLLAGVAYVAPGGFHTLVESRRHRLIVRLSPTADKVQPSVDILFTSAAAAVGPRAIAALLTGMGDDGAQGMAELARAGSHTIAQDEATSAVFGMPRAAIDAGAARETLPLSLIGGRLRQLASATPDTAPRGSTGAFIQEGAPCSQEKL
jgi:two-component system, chemotaxis family, protein-glutamate methylesterase/glutaminase